MCVSLKTQTILPILLLSIGRYILYHISTINPSHVLEIDVSGITCCRPCWCQCPRWWWPWWLAPGCWVTDTPGYSPLSRPGLTRPSLITALSPHTAHSQDRTGAPGLMLSPADTHMGPLTGNIFGKNDITPPSHSLKTLNTSQRVISEISAIFTWDQGPLPPACPAMSCSVAGPAPPPTQHRFNPGSLLAVVVINNNAM